MVEEEGMEVEKEEGAEEELMVLTMEQMQRLKRQPKKQNSRTLLTTFCP